jgi:hypothetical protein
MDAFRTKVPTFAGNIPLMAFQIGNSIAVGLVVILCLYFMP